MKGASLLMCFFFVLIRSHQQRLVMQDMALHVPEGFAQGAKDRGELWASTPPVGQNSICDLLNKVHSQSTALSELEAVLEHTRGSTSRPTSSSFR